MKRKECESTTVEADVDIQSEPGELHLLYPAVIFWSPLLDCSQLPAWRVKWYISSINVSNIGIVNISPFCGLGRDRFRNPFSDVPIGHRCTVIWNTYCVLITARVASYELETTWKLLFFLLCLPPSMGGRHFDFVRFPVPVRTRSYAFVRVRPRPRSLNRFRAITRKPLNIFQRNLLHALIIIW